MESHDFAKLFPAMSGEEFAALKADMQIHGQRDAIVLCEGKILDGRNRWKACESLGKKPRTRKFGSEETDGDDPLAFVLSLNLQRRNLDESQRAMVAARLANLKDGQKKAGSPIGLAQPDAARQVGVGLNSIKSARKVLSEGSPELVKAVEQGRLTVSAAKQIVGLPRKDQVAVATEPDDRERAKLLKAAKERARNVPKPEPIPDEVALTSTRAKTKEKSWFTVDEWKALSQVGRADLISRGFEAEHQGMNEQTGTSIEWARFSHNTVTGCLHDCPYCYARDIAERLYKPFGFAPVFHPNRLAGPGTVKVPSEAHKDESYRHIFANSMSDLFGQWVPVDWIEATIEMAVRNPAWRFLTLTKFPQRAADFDFPDNWWMGTTVDAQARVANAEKAFEKIHCKTKWLSVEPLLQPLTFQRLDLFQWVVIGGSSESTRTPKWVPSFDLVARLHLAAVEAGCRVYHKTNLDLSESVRVRQFPWTENKERVLPEQFRYLKGL